MVTAGVLAPMFQVVTLFAVHVVTPATVDAAQNPPPADALTAFDRSFTAVLQVVTLAAVNDTLDPRHMLDNGSLARLRMPEAQNPPPGAQPCAAASNGPVMPDERRLVDVVLAWSVPFVPHRCGTGTHAVMISVTSNSTRFHEIIRPRSGFGRSRLIRISAGD